jgi:hypothetical protein
VQRRIRVGILQGLKVGVDGDELDARHLRLNHPVDGVDTRAADADDAQDSLVGPRDRRRLAHVGLVAAEGRTRGRSRRLAAHQAL